MTKNEFRELFLRALKSATDNAEEKLAKQIPRSFVIELNAPEYSGRRVSVDEAMDQIYLGNDRFYKIIDVAIKELLPREAVVFVRVSGHSPVEFSETWDPSALGPFKQMISVKIEDQHS